MSIAEVDNSLLKIPVKGVSVSSAYDKVPPFLTALTGVVSLNFLASFAPALLLLLLPQATKANAAAETTPTEPNTLDNFILVSPI